MEISKLDKNISLEDFLNAYKIPGVGPKLSKNISDKVKNASTLRNLLEENKLKDVLLEVDGLGGNLSKNIINTLMDVDFFITLEDMEENHFDMFKDSKIYDLSEISELCETITIKDVSGTIKDIKGLKIVITGTLSLPRKFFETAIMKLGGSVANSVSNSTDILIYSTSDGMSTTKYKAATKINSKEGYEKIKMLTEADFNALVKKIEATK